MALVHPLITKHWEPKKTLEENYEKLGFVASVNGLRGGKTKNTIKERDIEVGDSTDEDSETGMDIAMHGMLPDDEMYNQLKVGVAGNPASFAQIAALPEDISLEKLLESGPTVASAFQMGTVVGKLHPEHEDSEQDRSTATKEPKVIDELERIANDLAKIRPARQLSEQEQKSLQLLMSKHGDNYEAMARDKKLNPFLYTAGQMRKKCEKLLGRR
ncbi:Nucleolar protein 16 [Gonapodya sp. JEL0774]|nr:Nucleolar protein 16 [Gonapodya sp. JEL0774]